jgi:hypothetical protein
LLKHVTAAETASLRVGVVKQSDLASAERLDPGDEVEQRALAAAGRADDGDEVARVDRQRDITQRFERVPPFERLVNPADLKQRAGSRRF